MMRPDPGKQPSPVEVQPAKGMVRQVRRYELITPLFGGGVQPQQADPITTVRGSEIRGHLRFWWRACCGAEYGSNLHSLKQAEDELWGAGGGTDGPKESQVSIAFTIVDRGRPFIVLDRSGSPMSIGHFRSPYSYVAFPMQQYPNAVTVEGIAFDLEIVFPAARQKDVEAALWAWQTFGGIGGRTRRGFGALCCRQIDGTPVKLPAASSLRTFLQEQINRYVSDKPSPPNLPHLTRQTQFRLSAVKPNSLAAWQYLIQKLKDFRQARQPGVQPNRPGRSLWPEPDAIRRRFPHMRLAHTARHPVDKFPRAAFGLPIIFHFKDRDDPPQTALQGADVARLASPLIMRPILCSDGAAALGLILEGSSDLPGGLELDGAPTGASIVTKLTPADTASIRVLNGEPNVLIAFLKTL